MRINRNLILNIFFWLVAASFLTLVIYSTKFSSSIIPKSLFFYAVVELTLPFYLYLCFKFYGVRHLKNPVVYFFGAYIIVSFVAALVGVDFIHSFWSNFERMQGIYFSLHAFLWMAYLLLLFRVDETKKDLLINILIGIAIPASILGIFQAFKIGTLVPSSIGRATSLYDNPIFFAAFLIIPFFLSLQQVVKYSEKRYWYLGFAVVILLGIASTKAAGAFVGLAAGLAVSLLVYLYDKNRRNIAGIALIVMVVLAVAGVLVATKVPSLKNKFVGDDAKSRLIEWGIALKGFVHRPILGVGPENYSYISDKYINSNIYNYSNGFFDKPHNYFLEVLTTTGIIGFAVYIGLLVMVVRGLFGLYKRGELNKMEFALLIGAFVAYLVQNAFAFDVIAAAMVWVLLMAYSATGIESKPEQQVIEKNNYANVGFAFASLLFVFLLLVNLKFARADIHLTSAIRYSQINPALSEKYFEELATYPFYTDKPRIAANYEAFVNQVPQQITTQAITSSTVDSWISGAIRMNQEVVDRKPFYTNNQLSLARLYLTRSQIQGTIDPKINQICDQINQFAPNRTEANLILSTTDALAGNTDQAQSIMDKLNHIAPNNQDIEWQQVYIYALSGKQRPVLDQIKAIISQHLNDEDTAQLDKIATYYANLHVYSQAEAVYNEALQVYPDNAYFFIQLARIYALSGDKQTAQQVINRLKETYPQYYPKYQSQAEAILGSPQ